MIFVHNGGIYSDCNSEYERDLIKSIEHIPLQEVIQALLDMYNYGDPYEIDHKAVIASIGFILQRYKIEGLIK